MNVKEIIAILTLIGAIAAVWANLEGKIAKLEADMGEQFRNADVLTTQVIELIKIQKELDGMHKKHISSKGHEAEE